MRRSYLFVVDAREDNIDKLIEYAQIGHFGTIIFLKDNWLRTHGHYQINTANFPGGVESLKRAVEKIHAAGMAAGVHVFGPSISPNDPYVTPKPDDRLACVPCPPLAEAVDAKTTTLVLTGLPKLPPYAPRRRRLSRLPSPHRRRDRPLSGRRARAAPALRAPPARCAGTKAAPHPARSPVQGLLTMWSYFLVDPDSSLADELTGNFAAVFNACGFDMAYFDASDGIDDAYLDRRYYLNKLHLGFYRKLNKDVLYQTSNGTGADLVWHIVPRSASADGHGDLKRYLDERLPGVLGMADNWTHADVGWYYMYERSAPTRSNTCVRRPSAWTARSPSKPRKRPWRSIPVRGRCSRWSAATNSAGSPASSPRASRRSSASRNGISSSSATARAGRCSARSTRSRGSWKRSTAGRMSGLSATTGRLPARWASRSPTASATCPRPITSSPVR